MGKTRTGLLSTDVRHIDIKKFNFAALAEIKNTAFQARNTASVAKIYEKKHLDEDGSVILCLADSQTNNVAQQLYSSRVFILEMGKHFEKRVIHTYEYSNLSHTNAKTAAAAIS